MARVALYDPGIQPEFSYLAGQTLYMEKWAYAQLQQQHLLADGGAASVFLTEDEVVSQESAAAAAFTEWASEVLLWFDEGGSAAGVPAIPSPGDGVSIVTGKQIGRAHV